MANLLHLRVESLRSRPRQVEFDEPVTTFPALLELAGQGALELPGTLSGRLVATLADDVIEVEGVLACEIRQACSRCLKPVSERLDVPVLLSYVRAAAGEVAADESERELDEAEMGLIPFHGDEIDLAPELAQEVIMALPQRPLCIENCAGLCPVCGGDLNLKACGCQPPVFHSGLAALKDFKISKD